MQVAVPARFSVVAGRLAQQSDDADIDSPSSSQTSAMITDRYCATSSPSACCGRARRGRWRKPRPESTWSTRARWFATSANGASCGTGTPPSQGALAPPQWVLLRFATPPLPSASAHRQRARRQRDSRRQRHAGRRSRNNTVGRIRPAAGQAIPGDVYIDMLADGMIGYPHRHIRRARKAVATAPGLWPSFVRVRLRSTSIPSLECAGTARVNCTARKLFDANTAQFRGDRTICNSPLHDAAHRLAAERPFPIQSSWFAICGDMAQHELTTSRPLARVSWPAARTRCRGRPDDGNGIGWRRRAGIARLLFQHRVRHRYWPMAENSALKNCAYRWH